MARPKLYTEKLAGNITACIGFVETAPHKIYVPNTIFEDDIRKNTNQTYRILLIYRKPSSDMSYSEIVYAAKKVDWTQIHFPNDYKKLPLPKCR